MKNKIISGLRAVCFTSASILFIYWLGDLSPNFPIKGSPSGWWWFWCLLGGIFLSELND